ncbi:OLC1v1018130C1 [Oldenlandia corymbosa var. corymbosa]|uniref:OLC1v1018130C1 n=1 Tax=Oldenlandia corymbosa var. corymbosa TaxID=529605 RepID=A0AAV1EB46_OLDCO|nr:OLC1v1018130C1 [Oldenlandia corymbosa var. corymbosa]
MGKNKFIDKKKSATYQILARDTSDPNYSSGPSGDRVFVRVDNNQYQVEGFSDDEENEHYQNDAVPADDPDSIFADAPDDYGYGSSRSTSRTGSLLPDHIRKEILELGFPDDGYNYLLHLREIKNSGAGSFYYENPKAKFEPLPPDVKAYNASKVEIARVKDDSDETSMYAVASKTLNAKVEKVVDDDIAALLDDSDFGSDVEDLEEDFVVKANLPEAAVDLELDKKLKLLEQPKKKSVEMNAVAVSGKSESLVESRDEKPRARRPLDEQFDLLELQEYGTESEEENGYYDDFEEDDMRESLAEKLNHALKDRPVDGTGSKYVHSGFLQDKQKLEDVESPESTADVIQKCKEYAEVYENESEDEKEVVFMESSDESEEWDCETIVSTYSNLDNHPGKIETPGIRRKKKLTEAFSGNLSSSEKIIALKGKEKLPVDFLPGGRKAAGDKAKDANVSKPDPIKRKQHGQESKEEKKERKAAVKEERREARKMKKEIKGLYKSEVQRAQRFAAVAGPSSVHIILWLIVQAEFSIFMMNGLELEVNSEAF